MASRRFHDNKRKTRTCPEVNQQLRLVRQGRGRLALAASTSGRSGGAADKLRLPVPAARPTGYKEGETWPRLLLVNLD
jgi:hypothetical protein